MRCNLNIAFSLILLIVVLSGGPAAAVPIQSQKPVSDYLHRIAPPISAEARQAMESHLADARAKLAADPTNAESTIWLGRRLAYLGRFSEAIELYTNGIGKFPTDARFYRHRGHRYITVRRFDLAIADLSKAATLIHGKPDQVEPDGQPNARNIPTSTLQFNIWYHLGLAYYLTGNNQKALAAYRECLKVSRNPDALVATTHWMYMTLRRLGREREATELLDRINEGMDVIENAGYYDLLKMYKNLVSADMLLGKVSNEKGSATSHSVLYGVANWHLYNDRREAGIRILRDITASNQWTSFGYIAAEADLARLTSQ